MGNSSDLILAYFEKEIKQEHIIDPYSILLKMITVGIYVIDVTCTLVMFSFVVYERSAGPYRSIINQLLAYFYGIVSSVLLNSLNKKSVFDNFLISVWYLWHCDVWAQQQLGLVWVFSNSFFNFCSSKANCSNDSMVSSTLTILDMFGKILVHLCLEAHETNE